MFPRARCNWEGTMWMDMKDLIFSNCLYPNLEGFHGIIFHLQESEYEGEWLEIGKLLKVMTSKEQLPKKETQRIWKKS